MALWVRLVGGVKKWEDRKSLVFPNVCLVGGVEKFLFGWREKGENGKCSFYKLTITSLLYNIGKVRGVGECNKVRVFV